MMSEKSMKPWAKKAVFIALATLLNVFFTFLCIVFLLKTKIWAYAVPALFLVYCFELIVAERGLRSLGMKSALSIALTFGLPMAIAAAVAITAVILNETGASDIFSVFLYYAGALISFFLSAAALVFRALFALGELLTSLISKTINKNKKKNALQTAETMVSDDNEQQDKDEIEKDSDSD